MPQEQHKVVKCKFKDQEETRATPDEDAAADAAANAATPPAPRAGARQPPLAGWSLQRPPSLPVALLLALGARASGWHGVAGRMLGPKADAN